MGIGLGVCVCRCRDSLGYLAKFLDSWKVCLSLGCGRVRSSDRRTYKFQSKTGQINVKSCRGQIDLLRRNCDKGLITCMVS